MARSIPSTPKQNSTLFRFTLLKFWQPAQDSPPDRKQASSLIDKCFAWLDAKNAGDSAKMEQMREKIIDEARKWFPDWDGASLGIRFKRKKQKPTNYEKPAENSTSNPRAGSETPNATETDEADETSGSASGGSAGGGAGDGNTNGSGGDGTGGDSGDSSAESAPKPASPDCNGCNGHGDDDGCPECGGRKPANGAWTCSKCGQNNKPSAKKCDVCHQEKPQPKPSQPKPKGSDSGKGDGTCPEGQEGSEGEGSDGESNQPNNEDDDLDPVLRELIARIKAGLRNFYLYGPAGTGKTTLAKLLGHVLSTRDFLGFQWPVTVLSCNAGTSPSEIRGFYFPERRHSIITQALSMPGIIVLDEYTTLDPSVAAGANALLANGEIETSMGNIKRHEHCVIIVTSNTLGTGADREYIGNNQLDAATLDRFVGGYMEVNYNLDYERKYDKQVVDFIWMLRKTIEKNGYRRVVSTRAIQACTALKKAGLEWKSKAVASWTSEERMTIPGWGEASEKKLFPTAKY